MMIVGQVSGKKEAKEMELIAKVSLIGHRAQKLSSRRKKGM